MEDQSLEKKFSKFIIAVSIVIPVVVAILFGIKLKDFGINVEPLSFFLDPDTPVRIDTDFKDIRIFKRFHNVNPELPF